MSGSTDLGGIVAGLATAAVEASSPGLLEKAQTAVSHGFEVFASHNKDLIPFGETLLTFGEAQANKHGYSVITEILNGLIGIFVNAPSGVTVALPPASTDKPAPAGTATPPATT